jgi:hypothetical protein
LRLCSLLFAAGSSGRGNTSLWCFRLCLLCIPVKAKPDNYGQQASAEQSKAILLHFVPRPTPEISAFPVKTKTLKPRYLFFLRIIQRKTASHFCWKCSLEWVYSFWLPPTTNLH